MFGTENEEPGHGAAWPETTDAERSSPRQLRVLYVEDDAASRSLIRRAFSLRTGWHLLQAHTLAEGKAMLYARPDVVLLDIQLPDGEGYQLLGHIRDNPLTRDIPVIAVTANALKEQVEQGMAAGFFRYITKPLDLNQLFKAVEAAALLVDADRTAL